MNGLEALLRLERKPGRRDPAVSWYVEGWLPGEDADKDGHVFETGQGLAPLNRVAPKRPVRLRISKGADKDSDLSMLDKMRAEVGRGGSTHSLKWDAFVSATVFGVLQQARRRSEGVGAGHRRTSRYGREETPC
jgi:hypothetical protein